MGRFSKKDYKKKHGGLIGFKDMGVAMGILS